jgi:hypothetical protein
MPAANALSALCDESRVQSVPSYLASVPTRALMRGKFFGSCVSNISEIHAAFDPPPSVEDTSPIMIGFAGASAGSS